MEQDVLTIDLEARTLQWQGQLLRIRSDGLLRFLSYLWLEADGRTVSAQALSRVLPSIAPRQMQRYVEKLEQSGMSILAYKNKTVGPWRLLPQMQCHQGRTAWQLWLMGKQAPAPSCQVDLPLYQKWISQVYSFTHAEVDSTQLQPWQNESCYGIQEMMSALLHVRSLILLNHFEEAKRVIDCILLHSLECTLSRTFKVQAKLLNARIAYNKSLYEAAERQLAEIHAADLVDLFNQGQYHNLHGLLSCRELKMQAWPAENTRQIRKINFTQSERKKYLAQSNLAEQHFQHALTCWLACFSPQFVQAALFNIGNTIYSKALCRISDCPRDDYQLAANWFVECLRYCRINFSGIETRLCEVTLLNLILDAGLNLSDWPDVWTSFFRQTPSMESLAKELVKEASVWKIDQEISMSEKLLNRVLNDKY